MRIKEMKVKTIKSLCGMLAVLAFTACSSNIDESADAPRFYNVTLTASMGDGETRALSEGADNAIIASFAENEEELYKYYPKSYVVRLFKQQEALTKVVEAAHYTETEELPSEEETESEEE